jgi:hypothetical protein
MEWSWAKKLSVQSVTADLESGGPLLLEDKNVSFSQSLAQSKLVVHQALNLAPRPMCLAC